MSLVTCPECDLRYPPEEPDELRQHDAYHRRWADMSQRLGERVMTYHEMSDALSREGQLRLSNVVEDRLRADLIELKYLFHRSLRRAIRDGDDRSHATFHEYAAALDLESKFGDRAVVLRKRYALPRKPSPMMRGTTYWGLTGSTRAESGKK